MSLPVIRGTSAALYPFTITVSHDTGVAIFENGSQQRWMRRYALAKLTLNYTKLLQYQRDSLKAGFGASKGQFDPTNSLTILGVTFNNLSFDSDVFKSQEVVTTQYGTAVTLTQVLSGQYSGVGTAYTGAAFPTLLNGAMTQLPYTQKKTYQTIVNKMPSGVKYVFSQFGGGLAGFPNDGLMGWDIEERDLLDADLTTRISHFCGNWGRYYIFPFTDEDGTVYNAHYDSDEMVCNYIAPNQNSMKISLAQQY